MIARRRPPRDAVVLLVLAAVLALLACTGCGGLPRVEAPPRPVLAGYGAGPSDGALTAAGLRAERDKLAGRLAAVDERLRRAEREAREAPLRALFTWASWLGGLAILGGVVAAVALRCTWPLWISACGAAALLVGQLGAALLPYRMHIGIGAGLLALAWAWRTGRLRRLWPRRAR